jgi:hypothetical protein
MENSLIPTFISSIVALVIAVAGIFQDRIRRALMGARLKAEFEMKSPFIFQKHSFDAGKGIPIESFYFRVGVTNQGSSSASKTTVTLAEIQKKDEQTGAWKDLEWFVPINLDWCHGVGVEYPEIHPGSTAYFDLGLSSCSAKDLASFFGACYGAPNLKKFHLATSRIDAVHAGYSLLEAQYRMRIHISATNCDPLEVNLEFLYAPGWSSDTSSLTSSDHTRLTLLSQYPQSLIASTRRWMEKAMQSASD